MTHTQAHTTQGKDWIDLEYERLKAIIEKNAQNKKFFESLKKTQSK